MSNAAVIAILESAIEAQWEAVPNVVNDSTAISYAAQLLANEAIALAEGSPNLHAALEALKGEQETDK